MAERCPTCGLLTCARSPADKWQEIALGVLLDLAGTYERGPWVPSGEAVAAIQLRMPYYCSHQAATGALRALRTVGLSDSCATFEGTFWKPTDAAVRAGQLLRPLPEEGGEDG